MTGASERPTAPARRPGGRWVTVGIVVALLAVVLSLGVDRIALLAARRLAPRYLPWPGATLTIDRADLGLGRLRLRGVRLDLDADNRIMVEHAELRFGVADLIAQRLHFLGLTGVGLTARRGADGWSWLSPLTDTSRVRRRAPVTIDSLTVQSASFTGTLDRGRPLATVDSGVATARNVRLGPTPSLELLALDARVRRIGPTPSTLTVSGAGRYGDARLVVDSILVGGVRIDGTIGPLDDRAAAVALHGRGRRVALSQFDLTEAGVLADWIGAVDFTVGGDLDQPRIEGSLALDPAGAIEFEVRVDRDSTVPRLHARASVEALPIDRLGAAESTRLDGTLAAELTLGALDSLEGPVRLDLHSAVSGEPIHFLGSATFRGGEADLDLDARVREHTARVRGRLRPLDSLPVFAIDVTSHFDLPLPAGLAEREPGWRGPWDARVRIAGAGLGFDTLDGEITGELITAQPGLRGGCGHIDGRIDRGVVRSTSTICLGDATVAAQLVVPLTDPLGSFELTEARVTGVRLAPWLGGADAGRLELALAARAEAGKVSGSLAIDSIRGGRLDGLVGRFAFTKSGSRVDVAGDARLGTAGVRIDTTAIDGSRLTHLVARVASFDPSTIDPVLPSGAIAGRLVLAPLPPTLAPPTGDPLQDTRLAGRFTLIEASLGGAPIDGGLDLRVERGEIEFDGTVDSGEQQASFAGTVSPRLAPIRLAVERVGFRGLDPAFWTDGRLPRGRLTGTARGSLQGVDPATAVASLTVRLDTSTIGPLRIGTSELDAELRSGQARASARAVRGDYRFVTAATARRGDGGGWRGAGTTVFGRATERADSVTLRFEFESPDSMAAGPWRANLLGGGAIDRVELDTVDVAFTAYERMLTIERLLARGPDLSLEGDGRLPLLPTAGDADLTLEGNAEELGGLIALAGYQGYRGRGRFGLRSVGSAGAIAHQLSLQVVGFRSRSVEFDSISVVGTGRSDSSAVLALAAIEGTVGGRRPLMISLGGLPILAGLGSGGAFGTSTPGAVRFTADWSAADPRRVGISEILARVDGEDWTLDRPVSVRVDDSVTVSDLVLRSSAGTLEAGGRLAPHGEQRAHLEVRGLGVQLRRPDADRALAGRLELSARLVGPADRPIATVRGRVSPAPDATFGPLTVDAAWRASGLQLTVTETSAGETRSSLVGTLPLALAIEVEQPLRLLDQPVDLTIRANDFDLSGLAPVFDERLVDGLRGRLRADLRVGGSTNAPELDGSAAIEEFSMVLPRFETELQAARLGVRLQGDRATLTEFTLQSAHRGSARLEGELTFPELTIGRIDLRATLDRFVAAAKRELAATLSGEVRIAGTFAAPVVSGRVVVDEASYQVSAEDLPVEFEAVELTEADYRELERRFGIGRDDEQSSLGRLWSRSEIDLEISAQSDVWARRPFEPAMAIEVGGSARLQKQPDQPYRVVGAFQVVEGRSFVEEFGRRFEITKATARFDGPPTEAEINAEATYRPTDDVTIRLLVKGTKDSLSLTLSSEPALDESDIVSYIAVGRSTTEAFRTGTASEDASSLGVDVGLSRIGSGVQDLARQTLGLDVVEIRQDGIRGLTLVAGRYLNRRLYLGFEQGVGFRTGQGARSIAETTAVDVEYRIASWLLTNLTAGRTLARFFLRTRHAY